MVKALMLLSLPQLGINSAFNLPARVEISAPHLAIAARVGGGASFFPVVFELSKGIMF